MIFNESEILSSSRLGLLARLHSRAGERALKGGHNPTIALHFGLAARFGEEAFLGTSVFDKNRRNGLAIATVINYANANWPQETVRAGNNFIDSLGGDIFPRVNDLIGDLVESAQLELSTR